MAGKGIFNDLLPPPQQSIDTTLAELMRYKSFGIGAAFPGAEGAGKTLHELLAPPKPAAENAFLLGALSNALNGFGSSNTAAETPLARALMSNALNGFGASLPAVTNPDQNPYLLALLGLGATAKTPAVIPPQWIAVERRFRDFHKALAPTTEQQQDVRKKTACIIECLNRAYRSINEDIDYGFQAGSWAKQTAIYPWSDVDLYFVLPPQVFDRFQAVDGNRQSRLLQEVRSVLLTKYPRTDIRGDGQVVVVDFDSQKFEVIPAFLLVRPNHYFICDTNRGGGYSETAPWDERDYIDRKDRENGYNVRPLSRMLKAWRYNCCVPIKAFQLEMMAAEFLEQSPWRFKSWFYYDWIVRDFFEYMPKCKDKFQVMPGTGVKVHTGSAWVSYANTARERAARAADLERYNLVAAAGVEWRKIFGTAIPWE